jgi:hypothetical protein
MEFSQRVEENVISDERELPPCGPAHGLEFRIAHDEVLTVLLSERRSPGTRSKVERSTELARTRS